MQNGVTLGSTTVYMTAVVADVTQAITTLPPVAFANCTYGGVSVGTGLNGHGAIAWLPDGTYATSFSVSPGLPYTTSITLGASSSSNLVAESSYVMINAQLTRIYLYARTSGGNVFLAHSGNWLVSGGLSLPVNGQAISPSFWLPNGSYTGTLSGASSTGSSPFQVGTPTASGQRPVVVSSGP